MGKPNDDDLRVSIERLRDSDLWEDRSSVTVVIQQPEKRSSKFPPMSDRQKFWIAVAAAVAAVATLGSQLLTLLE